MWSRATLAKLVNFARRVGATPDIEERHLSVLERVDVQFFFQLKIELEMAYTMP